MKLLLFDINGTLLTTDGAGRTAMRQVAKELFSLEENLTGITIDGNTDGGIVRQILAKHALPVTKENINRYLEGYLICLKKNLSKTPGTILPGVSDLLNAVDTAHCAKGLLTGNLECGAHLKLRAHRLADRFEFGAFSNDSFDRNDLGPLAKARAGAKYNLPFDPSEMFVIGDTPHNIACGKAVGARTVAVATGGYRAKDLAVHEPDFLFEDLSQTSKVLQVFGLA